MTVKLVKCNICGYEFGAIKENHYISRDDDKQGVMSSLVIRDERKLYDTFDCPCCGCQVVVQERKRHYFENMFEDCTEEDDEEEEDDEKGEKEEEETC